MQCLDSSQEKTPDKWEEEFLHHFAAFCTMTRLGNPEQIISMTRIHLCDMLWQRAKNFQEEICNPYNGALCEEWERENIR